MLFPAGLSTTVLGLAAQMPVEVQPPQHAIVPSTNLSSKTSASLFTPKDLVELPSTDSGVANSVGDLALVPVSRYSLDENTNEKTIYLVPIESTAQPIEVPLQKVGQTFWLDTRTVAHAVVEGKGEDEATALYVVTIEFDADAGASTLKVPGPPVLIGKFPTPSVSNFKFSATAGVLVFSDYVHADGDLTAVKANDKAWEERGDSAYMYDESYVRHWDTWGSPKKSSLFTVKLSKGVDDKWHFGNEFVNLFRGIGHACPVGPFGGSDDFDVSAEYVIYTAKDPQLPKTTHNKQNIYIVALDGSTKPRELTHGKFGATKNPVFSNAGDRVAWLQLDKDEAESDRAKVVIHDLRTDVHFTLTQHWDRSPDSITFSNDDKVLYMGVGEHARDKIFALGVPPTPAFFTTDPELPAEYRTPVALTSTGSVKGIQPLPGHRLLFTRSSLAEPNDLYMLRDLQTLGEPPAAPWHGEAQRLTKFSADALVGKYLDAGEEFWFEGAKGVQVQGWLLKPSGFKKGDIKKWPVVMLIHGGPEMAWKDEWMSNPMAQWNANIYANQGYMTLCLNFAGSSTFGQAFTDSIAGDWGGRPFVDLQKGWAYILDKYPEIDADRAVAAGPSWGGYAINYIQGMPEFNFGFKALVCHDGMFSPSYMAYATDELVNINYAWGGDPWGPKAKELYDKYSPDRLVHKWSTPELIIHGAKDYRLPETEAIGAFHALLQRGVPARLLIFPDENHFVLRPHNVLKWFHEVFRWFDKYVGDAE